jgi:rhamnosyltransferase subunit B
MFYDILLMTSPEPMTAMDISASKCRAIVFAAGSDGDIHPHLGLASEMTARGHKVLFLTSFDYLDLARSCGFEALSIIDAHDKDHFESAKGLAPVKRFRSRCDFFRRKVSAICDLVAARLDERSILIAPPFACPVAKLLHLRYRVPYVSTVLSPAQLCSLRDPPAFKSGEWFSRLPWAARRFLFHSVESLIIDPGFRWLLKDQLRSLPGPPPRRVISEWSWSPQRILGLFAEWFCPAARDWPPQLVFTGFPLFHPQTGGEDLSASLRRFLDTGPPPIVFTAGTETSSVRNFFDIALGAAQSLGLRAVFLSRLGDQLPVLPGTIHHESYASLQFLLRRAAAIVHHGGIGTTAQAIRAGIPQAILPGRLDQFDNAQHVERLGCGLAVKGPLDKTAAIEKVQRLLQSAEIADACRNLRERMVSGPAACARAADAIEEVWRSARPAHHVPPSFMHRIAS